MPCPRCDAAVDPQARSCPACALPLAFDDEPAPALEVTIELDRRAAARARSNDPDLDRCSVHPERSAATGRAESKGPCSDHPERSAAAGGAESKGACSGHPERSAAAGGAESKDPALRRAAAWALDAAVVALAAALPLAVAWRGIGPAHASLAALALPAAGFVVLLGASYAVLSRLLAGATLGKLAFAPRTRGEVGHPPAPSRSLASRAP